jgi:RNA polymerase sigma-70 factor (ECF subfamily)
VAENQPDGFVFSTEDILIAHEHQQNLQEQITLAINRLPARQREIIYLRYYQELTLPEIAQTLGISYQTVANHLQAAYRSLSKEKSIYLLLAAATGLALLTFAFRLL